MDKEQAVELLLKRLSEWESKPKGDGYEYEKSFIEVMQDLNRDLFQLSLGEISVDRNAKKKIQTQLGLIEIPKTHDLCPKNGFRQSVYLQDTCLYLGQSEIFSKSEELLERLCGIKQSDKQIENLCHHYGEVLESEYIKEEEVIVEKESNLYDAMVDGSYIMSRKDSWVETKLGRIFAAESNVSISEKRKTILASKYVGHIGSHTDFCQKINAVLQNHTNLVFIGDGAKWNMDSSYHVKTEFIRNHFGDIDSQIICDTKAKVILKHINEYDNKGKLVKVVIATEKDIDSPNSPIFYTTYSYRRFGNLVTLKQFKDASLIQRDSYKYDTQNRVIKESSFVVKSNETTHSTFKRNNFNQIILQKNYMNGKWVSTITNEWSGKILIKAEVKYKDENYTEKIIYLKE